MSIKSRLRQWLSDEDAQPSSPGPTDDYWYNAAPTVELSPQAALAVDAWYACCDRYASTISSLPFQVFERKAKGKRTAYEHPLYYVIHDSPNAELSAVEFWYTAVFQLRWLGNFIAKQSISSRKDVMQLKILDPWKVEVKRASQTDPLLRDTGYAGTRYYVHHLDDGSFEILSEDDVLHLAGPSLDGLKGCSPMEIHRRTIGGANYAEDYTSRFLANSGIPPAYISHPLALSDKSHAAITAWLKKMLNRGTAGTAQVLDRGMEIKTVPVNHRDLQYIELRKFQVEQICRINNMPPHRVQSLDRATFSNIEHQDIEYVKHTIMPVCRRIESRVNKALLGVREGRRYFCEFNLDALYRGDMVSRSQAFQTKIFSGQLSPNEARGYENENPYRDGDTYWMQSGTQPIERLLNPPESPAIASPAPANEQNPDDVDGEDTPTDVAEDEEEAANETTAA